MLLKQLNNFTTSFAIPSTWYNPTSSVIYHKPFGGVAILCACISTVSFLCFWPCVFIRGFCAKVRARVLFARIVYLFSIFPTGPRITDYLHTKRARQIHHRMRMWRLVLGIYPPNYSCWIFCFFSNRNWDWVSSNYWCW